MVADGQVIPSVQAQVHSAWPRLPYWTPSPRAASALVVGEVQFSSVAQSCPTLWDPMDHSTPGLPVHHQLPELAQTHVH